MKRGATVSERTVSTEEKVEWTAEQQARAAEIVEAERAEQARLREQHTRPYDERVKERAAALRARSEKVREELAASAEKKKAPSAGEEEETAASVPFMITRAMKDGLRARGYSDEQIRNMTPQEAHNILAGSGQKADETERDLGSDEPLPETDEPEPDDEGGEPGKVKDPLWKARSAIKVLKPDNRELVIRIGLALQSTGLAGAKELWCDWVGLGAADADVTWNNLAAGPPTNRPIGIGTLYWYAEKAGWRKPVVFSGNRLKRMAETAEGIMIKRGVELYQYGNNLVRPMLMEVEAADGRKANIALLPPITHSFLMGELSECVDWRTYNKKEHEYVECGPNRNLASLMLDRVGICRFRQVTGIIMAPTLRPDGSILIKPGYDPQTKLILFAPPKMPAMSLKPTKDEAVAALMVLKEVLREFPFVDEPSQSVALSLMLAVVVRAALACVPMHAFKAPVAGSGKSLLADLAAAMALGQPCPLMTAGADEEEMEKRLVQHLSLGKSLLAIDNIKKERILQGEALCQVIERDIWEPRILGTSTGVRLVNRWTIVSNGNNLKVAEDLTRRTLLSEINAKMDKPINRVFENDPLEMILRDRGRYVAAALTIVRAYLEAGQPVQGLSPVGKSFSRWSDLVRASLVWLDCVDPVLAMAKAEESDPIRQTQARVFSAIAAVVGVNTKFLARELIERVTPLTPLYMSTNMVALANLRDALQEVALGPRSALSSVTLGRWLNNNKDIGAGGYQVRTEDDTHERVKRFWIVSTVDEPQSSSADNRVPPAACGQEGTAKDEADRPMSPLEQAEAEARRARHHAFMGE
jgi:putative DNA primase/helicase